MTSEPPHETPDDRRAEPFDGSPNARLRRLLTDALDIEVDGLPAFLERAEREHPDIAGELRARLTGEDATAGEFARTIAHQAASVLATDRAMPGDHIGPYRIERVIGEGGMGTVYLAVHSTSGEHACIKVLKRGMDTDTLLERFGREQRILADLDHPYIARVIEGGSTPEGLPYFVMEYVDGVDIERYVTEHDLPLRDRLSLFLEVCEAVQFAHQRLVVHRDLKPANILVTPDGSPKLLDFGIAKLLDPDGSSFTTMLTHAGRLLTPEFASPEQIRGGAITTASDVYSLTVLLYRLLTERLPIDVPRQSAASIERAVCEQEPIRASTFNRRLRGDLDAILETGLRKEADQRYGSVRELALDIRRHLSGESVTARPSTALYRVRKFVRRNPVLASLALVTVISAIAISIQTVRVGRARDAASSALQTAASERDNAEAVATLLAEVLEVSDTDITFLESVPMSEMTVGNGSFSLSAWILTDAPSSGVRAILDKRVPVRFEARGISLFAYDDRLGLQIADARAVGDTYDGGGGNYLGRRDLADGRWHHVVAAARRDPVDADGDRVVLYVDGQVDAVHREQLRLGDVDSTAPLRVGYDSDGFHVAYPFQGSIHAPRLFDAFLDSADVAELYEYGRRQRRPFAAHVPSAVAVGAASTHVTIPLSIVSRADAARTYVWSVGGRASAERRDRIRLTRFDPTSGTIVLSPERRSAIVPIRVEVPVLLEGETHGFQVTVASIESGERLVASGELRSSSGISAAWNGHSLGGSPGATTRSAPRVVPTAAPLRIVIPRPPDTDLVCELHAMDPVTTDQTLRFDGSRAGEPRRLRSTDPDSVVSIVSGPCDVSVLHELRICVPGPEDELHPIYAEALVPECANATPPSGAWPAGVPAPMPVSFTSRTRTNAFMTDTAVRFAISTPVRARMEISDLSGRRIRRISLGELQPGQHSVGWDGRDESGVPVEPGLYAVNIYGEDYAVARWDEDRGRFARDANAEVIRTQVFRVRPHP